jgi:hypothetical protein
VTRKRPLFLVSHQTDPGKSLWEAVSAASHNVLLFWFGGWYRYLVAYVGQHSIQRHNLGLDVHLGEISIWQSVT